MTPDAKAVLEYQIGAVLPLFGIAEFRGVDLLRYGVWRMEEGRPRLVGGRLNYSDAHALVRRLQTEAIIQLIEETLP